MFMSRWILGIVIKAREQLTSHISMILMPTPQGQLTFSDDSSDHFAAFFSTIKTKNKPTTIITIAPRCMGSFKYGMTA
jgi:hypothetical protein